MKTQMILAVAAAMVCVPVSAGVAKNVIVLISDGAGANTLKATSFYEGKTGQQEVDGAAWSRVAASNHPLRFGTTPIAGAAGLAQDPNVVYNPAKAFDVTPVGSTTGGYVDNFAGNRFHKTTYPDSANTMVSISTGQKTYNNALNVDGNGAPLPTLAKLMKTQYGKSVGVATTVQWADATPAALGGAVNISRGNRNAVSNFMMTDGTLDVIIGGGNPDYDNNAQLRAVPNHSWISTTDWSDLKDGNNSGLSANWQLAQNKADFEAAANGTFALAPGKKFLGMHKSFDAHQSYRSGIRNGVLGVGPNPLVAGGFASGGNQQDNTLPYTDPMNAGVPSLVTMAQATINLLDDNANGFFAAIEAGGVDRAMHANANGRMIEDQIEFNDTVEWVASYLNANTNGNNWENTLVIVTADHDHLMQGPNSDTIAFDAIVDNGAGNMPGHKWQFNSHSNFTVPVFARGVGAELFGTAADQMDLITIDGRTFGNGAYLDQTDIHGIITTVIVPEPSALAIALPVAAVALRRRK